MSELRAPLWQKLLTQIPPEVARAMAVDTIVFSMSSSVLETVTRMTSPSVGAEALVQKGLAPLPANRCWIEFPSFNELPAFAMSVRPLSPVSDALNALMPKTASHMCALTVPSSSNGLSTALVMPLIDGKPVGHEPLRLAHMQGQSGVPHRPDWDEAAPVAGGLLVKTCALLAAHGATTVEVEKRRARKLQQWRGQMAPRVEYRVVDMNLDDNPQFAGKLTDQDRQAIGRALHHVRGHLRLTESRGLVAVRPHWRGDSRFGVRYRDYNVIRDGELH